MFSTSRIATDPSQRKRKANATVVEHWSNLSQFFFFFFFFFKKRAKKKIQWQFSACLTSQTSLLFNMSRDVSPKCVSVWLFSYRRNLVFSSPWSLVWNYSYTVENPNLLGCRLPRRYIDQSFSSVLRHEVRLIITYAKCTVEFVFVFFSKSGGRNNTNYAFK